MQNFRCGNRGESDGKGWGRGRVITGQRIGMKCINMQATGGGMLLERGADGEELQQGPRERGSGLLAKSGVLRACRLAH